MISFTLSHLMRASVPRVGAGLAAAARALLLLQGLFPSVLSRLMMTDDAAGAGAENAVMAGIVPGDSAPTAAPFRQPAACAGAATQPAVIKKARTAGNNINFI